MRARKLNDNKQNVVVTLVAVGMSQRQAARHVGCDPSTVTKLAARDDAFADRMRAARLRSEYGPLEIVQRHAEKSWRAATWLLEKCHPHIYGRNASKVDSRALEDQRDRLVEILSEEIAEPQLLARLVERVATLDAFEELPVCHETPPVSESSEVCAEREAETDAAAKSSLIAEAAAAPSSAAPVDVATTHTHAHSPNDLQSACATEEILPGLSKEALATSANEPSGSTIEAGQRQERLRAAIRSQARFRYVASDRFDSLFPFRLPFEAMPVTVEGWLESLGQIEAPRPFLRRETQLDRDLRRRMREQAAGVIRP